ncbi:Anhydro-N-acetylmuramic acid kinase [Penicillium riverlandense]|uniref:Anhydro-N-acetylmuramic acid kinase n=1 Tax=Penicillium riverlandense TaxID=1903569 RepID=UPI0025473CF8|nr:Anhydro-N-acetylmuramic acid kinase [Penicillium riverlandense]KAJ5815417.1 Anhydro-N-acetylmuramic acid kinase [Penicillium riverlandense]
MVTLNVLGLNCGTSVDGIDVAHCRISSIPSSRDVKIELLSYTEVPVNPDIRSQVLRLCRPNAGPNAATSMAEICDLNFELGREFTRAIEESQVDLAQVDLVASHGQTLWHQPVGEKRSTLQMAEPAVISHGTKRTVVSGFRVAELAAGRQGAPLSGFFEAGLLSNPELTRISQNIGGIGNATVLPASSSKAGDSKSKYFAFDTGPGNVFIDAAMRLLTNNKEHFDCDGTLGAQGETEIDNSVVEDYLTSEPYFQLQPPKTTGRELFSDDVARVLVEKMQSSGKTPAAIIATVTRITAESIARAYENIVLPLLGEGRRNIDEIYICGGGAYNPNILKHLRARFPQSRVMRLGDDGGPTKLDPSAKEAVLFALLGFLCVCGRSVHVAMDAETAESTVMGVVTPGENYRHVMEMVVRDQEFAKAGILGSILM